MGRYKTERIFYPNRWQPTEDLVADGYYCAHNKPQETIEIAAHIMDAAHENGDKELFDIGRDLMRVAHSPCKFIANYTAKNATDNNNRPSEPIVPEIPDYILDLSWEEDKLCFKNAVLRVMESKIKGGSWLFSKNTQWMAVYRFAVDTGIMYDEEDQGEPKDPSIPQYSIFSNFAHELQLDVNPPTRIPFNIKAIDSMGKENYARYRTRYPWSTDGLKNPSKGFTLYQELKNIYKNLERCFYNRIVSNSKTEE